MKYTTYNMPLLLTNGGHVNYEYLVIDTQGRFYVNNTLPVGWSKADYNGPIQVSAHVNEGENLYVMVWLSDKNESRLIGATRHLVSARKILRSLIEDEDLDNCYIVRVVSGDTNGSVEKLSVL